MKQTIINNKIYFFFFFFFFFFFSSSSSSSSPYFLSTPPFLLLPTQFPTSSEFPPLKSTFPFLCRNPEHAFNRVSTLPALVTPLPARAPRANGCTPPSRPGVSVRSRVTRRSVVSAQGQAMTRLLALEAHRRWGVLLFMATCLGWFHVPLSSSP